MCFNTKFESWGPDPRVRVCNRMSTVLAHTDLVFYDIFKKMKPSDNLYHVICFKRLRTNTDDSAVSYTHLTLPTNREV